MITVIIIITFVPKIATNVIGSLSKFLKITPALTEAADAELCDGKEKLGGLITSVKYLASMYGASKELYGASTRTAEDEKLDCCSSYLLPALSNYSKNPSGLVPALAKLEQQRHLQLLQTLWWLCC